MAHILYLSTLLVMGLSTFNQTSLFRILLWILCQTNWILPMLCHTSILKCTKWTTRATHPRKGLHLSVVQTMCISLSLCIYYTRFLGVISKVKYSFWLLTLHVCHSKLHYISLQLNWLDGMMLPLWIGYLCAFMWAMGNERWAETCEGWGEQNIWRYSTPTSIL